MKKRTRFTITIAILVFIILNSCTKETLETDNESSTAVVESYIDPGQDVYVKLKKLIPFVEDGYTGSTTIDSVNIFVNYNEVDFLLTPVNGESGLYKCLDSNLLVEAGKTYGLSFVYNNETVYSETTIPSKPQNLYSSVSVYYVDPDAGPGSSQEPFSVYWDNADNSYYQIIVEYLDQTYKPIRENMGEETFDDFRKFSAEPIDGDAYDLNTRRQLVFFGNYRLILYKVNQEYVNLYENISQSSLSLSEPLTNINNGLGIFTGVNSDTLFFQVKEY